MKRSHLNLGLLVMVAGLGATLYFTREQPPPPEPLTAMTPDAIDRVEVAHEGHPLIRLERSGTEWWLRAPVEAPADRLEVNGILTVASLPVKKRVDAGVDPAAVGLTPPTYTVTLNDQVLRFGGMEPLAFQRYVGIGDQVVLVDDPPSAALDADFSDLVSKQLVSTDAALQRIEVPGMTLEKGADGWTSPEHPDAASDALVAVVEGWRTAQAMWNAALEPGTEAPAESVTLHLADGGTRVFGIARREPQLELVDLDYQVRRTLSRALIDTLLTLPTASTESAPISAVDDTPG